MWEEGRVLDHPALVSAMNERDRTMIVFFADASRETDVSFGYVGLNETAGGGKCIGFRVYGSEIPQSAEVLLSPEVPLLREERTKSAASS